MSPRQHAVAALNAVGGSDFWVDDERGIVIEAVEREIALAVQEERDRCMAWVQQFETPETRRICIGIESGDAPPGSSIS